MKKRLYMDIHALQAVPASCINRDDAGSPKDNKYGGKIRGRVSSQAWKRAMRIYFAEHGEEIGIRTRKIKKCLIEKLVKMGIAEADAVEAVENAITESGLGSDKKDAKPVLVYLSTAQIEAMAKVIKERLTCENIPTDKKQKKKFDEQYKNALKQSIAENPTSDMILFGRMMASDANLNYDAAAQVAHAFTVNEAIEEYDYFTAVDDFSPKDDTGAGHIDTKSYNSGVYYRYANVNLSDTSELIRMDKENAAETARNFAEAFICSMPSGSCNSYANTTVPDVVTINLRANMPISYAPAFLEAIESKNYLKTADERLSEYEKDIDRKFGEPILRLTFKDMSLMEMLDRLEKFIQEEI